MGSEEKAPYAGVSNPVQRASPPRRGLARIQLVLCDCMSHVSPLVSFISIVCWVTDENSGVLRIPSLTLSEHRKLLYLHGGPN